LESLPADAKQFITGGDFKKIAIESYNKAGGNVTREKYVELRQKFRAAIAGDVPASAFAKIDALSAEQRDAIFKYASKGKDTLSQDEFVQLVGAGIVEILKASDASKYKVLADHWQAATSA